MDSWDGPHGNRLIKKGTLTTFNCELGGGAVVAVLVGGGAAIQALVSHSDTMDNQG